MLKSIIKKIKRYYRRDLEAYYGELLVSKFDGRIVRKINPSIENDYNGLYAIDLRGLQYRDDLDDLVIDFANIPYIDADFPTITIVDKDQQIKEVIYIREGLGRLHRTNREVPSHMKFDNGKIVEEHYASNHQTSKTQYGYTSYTVPHVIIYKNGLINQEESTWNMENQCDENFKPTTIKHESYKKMIAEIDIDIDNFKSFTLYERMAINMYMKPDDYIFKLKEFNIEATKESVKANLLLLKMIYI
jgi:hypothetical protein